jgi:NAD+ diphosphatase
MTADLFENNAPHPEPSLLTAFSGNRLDRQAEYRADDCVEKALASDGTHILAFTGARLILKHDGQILDPLFAPYELAELQPDFENAVLLGYKENGEPRIAVPVLIAPEELASHFKPTEARALFRDALVDEELQGEAAQAVALLNWNSANRFCGRCGSTTDMKIGGYKRVCTQCQHMLFPRTDPVVIMLTVDVENDRCLLGRSHHFQEGMYSCLAGFVEPGETIENAVRRETFEEAGISVGRVRYHASQPWPMPHSLMIGCYSEATSFEITIDPQEMQDVRWFSRAEAASMLDAGPESVLFAPVRGAIAHRLLRDWIEWGEERSGEA